MIGLLLVVVAFRLGSDSKDGLIGQAADPDELRLIRQEIESTAGVDKVVEVQTMYLGPESMIVAARVAFGDDLTADRAEDIAGEIDEQAPRQAVGHAARVHRPDPDRPAPPAP